MGIADLRILKDLAVTRMNREAERDGEPAFRAESRGILHPRHFAERARKLLISKDGSVQKRAKRDQEAASRWNDSG